MGSGSRFESNWFAFTLGAVSIGLLLINLFYPRWLYNGPLGLRYPLPREWGLLVIRGKITQSHDDQIENACRAAGTFSIMGFNCMFGVCRWYKAKCAAWPLLKLGSYFMFGVLCLNIMLMLLSILIQFRDNMKSIRLSAFAAIISAFICAMGLFGYFWAASTAFYMINATGYYPCPQPAYCFFSTQLVCIFMLASGFSQLSRLRRYREDVEIEQDAILAVTRAKKQLGIV